MILSQYTFLRLLSIPFRNFHSLDTLMIVTNDPYIPNVILTPLPIQHLIYGTTTSRQTEGVFHKELRHDR